MATKKVETTEIIVPAIDRRRMTLRIVGDSPLIMHKWTEKAKKEILDKQQKKAKKGREAKDPVADFIDSMYWLEGEPEEKTEEGFIKALENGARFGFPLKAFKASAVSAGYRAGITKDKVTMNGMMHVIGDYAEIKGSAPEMREDMVRVGMGTADIRYRGEFKNWYTEIEVVYNATVLSAAQVVNLFNHGGFACGVGEWRPEKGGTNGTYHVE